jgi:hypothetical protein
LNFFVKTNLSRRIVLLVKTRITCVAAKEKEPVQAVALTSPIKKIFSAK